MLIQSTLKQRYFREIYFPLNNKDKSSLATIIAHWLRVRNYAIANKCCITQWHDHVHHKTPESPNKTCLIPMKGSETSINTIKDQQFKTYQTF